MRHPAFSVTRHAPRAVVAFVAATLVAGVLTVAASPAQAAGTTYYVDNANPATCTDSGDGSSPSQPFCSLTPVAARTLVAGDTVLLKRGDTFSGVSVRLSGSGTATNPITLSAYGTGSRPEIDGNGGTLTVVVELEDPSYWTVSHLRVGYGAAGISAYYQTTGNHSLAFDDIDVHDIGGINQGSDDPHGTDPYCSTTRGIFRSAGIEITSPYGLVVPQTTSVIDGITMTGISGDHDYNVIGLDFCDAQVGDPSPGKSPPRRSWLARNVTIDHLVASDGDGAGHVYNCGEGLRITGVTNLVLSSSDVERLGQCYSDTGTIGVILVSVENVTFLDDKIVGVPNSASPDQGGIDVELFVDDLHLLGNLLGDNVGPTVEQLNIRAAGSDTGADYRANAFVGGAPPILASGGGGPGAPTGTAMSNLFTSAVPFYTRTAGTMASYGNDRAAGSAALFSSQAGFSDTAGRSGWSYQEQAGAAGPWTDLSYDATADAWTGADGSRVDLASQTPGSGAAVARTWTAPHSGAVAIRSVVARTLAGGALYVTPSITLDNHLLDGPGFLSAPTQPGQLDSSTSQEMNEQVQVRKGDVLRFLSRTQDLTGGVPGDSVAWTPQIAYVDNVGDPSFESQLLPLGVTSQYNPGRGPWQFSGTSGLVANDDPSWTPPAAVDGDQAAFVQQTGAISQAFDLPAGRFVVSFWAGVRNTAALQTLRVTVDGVALGTFTPTTHAYSLFTTPATSSLPPGPHTLRIDGTVATSDVTDFVDQVAVTPFDPGGFEDPQLTTGSYKDKPDSGPWAFAGSSGVASVGALGMRPPPEGSQAGYLGSGGAFTLSQTLPTGDYLVRYQVAGPDKVQVQLDGMPVLTAAGAAGFIPRSTMPAHLAAGRHSVTFVRLTGGTAYSFLDQVTLVPVGLQQESFEFARPVLTHFITQPPGSPWTFGENTGVLGPPTNAASDYGNPPAPDGWVSAYIQRTGTLSQTMTTVPPQGQYQLSFRTGNRPPGYPPLTVQASVAGTAVGQVRPATTRSFSAYSTGPFTLGPSSTSLSITGLNADDRTLWLDDVALTPVLANGSFVTPLPAETPFDYQPATMSWQAGATASTSTAGVARIGSAFGSPTGGSGGQYGFVQQRGTLSQTVYLRAGSYRLDWLDAYRPGYPTPRYSVLLDGTAVTSLLVPSASDHFSSATQGLGDVVTVPTDGMHTITFAGMTDPDATTLIDDVKLTPSTLPDPAAGVVGLRQGTYQVAPPGDGWSFTVPWSAGSGVGAGVSTSGSAAGIHRCSAVAESLPATCAFVAGTGSLSTSLYADTSTHTVSFRVAQPSGTSDPSAQRIEVDVDGVLKCTVTVPVNGVPSTQQCPFSPGYAGQHDITLRGLTPSPNAIATIDRLGFT